MSEDLQLSEGRMQRTKCRVHRAAPSGDVPSRSVLHSALCILHSAFCTLHSALLSLRRREQRVEQQLERIS
jgi:hypothetical protein